MNWSIFFVLLIGLWCFTQVDSRMYKALFFNRADKQLVEVSQHDDTSECTSCISACPSTSSDSDAEKLLNSKISITKNSVFLQRVYDEGTLLAKDMEVDICTKQPTPQLVYDTIIKDYHVGYEMYYEDGRVQLQCHLHKNFRKVVNGDKIQPENQPTGKDLITINRGETYTKFEIITNPRTKQWVFYWISVLEIKVRDSVHQRTIIFRKDTITKNFNQVETIYTCDRYYTGDGTQIIEDGEDEPIRSPSKKKQKIEHDILGTSNTTTVDDPQHTTSPQSKDRLVKTQILPIHMLHSLAARLATCIHLNFAFVWESIADYRLRSVDWFLYALYRYFSTGIHIDFGVNGDAGQVDHAAYEDQLFRKFPIPQVLYRVVKYTLYDEHYVAVIVIHNEPSTTDAKIDSICPDDELGGWDDIESADGTKGLSYACRLTHDLVQKFEYYNEFGKDLKVNDLKLDKFPHYAEDNNEKDNFYTKSVLPDIRKKLESIKKKSYNLFTSSSSS